MQIFQTIFAAQQPIDNPRVVVRAPNAHQINDQKHAPHLIRGNHSNWYLMSSLRDFLNKKSSSART